MITRRSFFAALAAIPATAIAALSAKPEPPVDQTNRGFVTLQELMQAKERQAYLAMERGMRKQLYGYSPEYQSRITNWTA